MHPHLSLSTSLSFPIVRLYPSARAGCSKDGILPMLDHLSNSPCAPCAEVRHLIASGSLLHCTTAAADGGASAGAGAGGGGATAGGGGGVSARDVRTSGGSSATGSASSSASTARSSAATGAASATVPRIGGPPIGSAPWMALRSSRRPAPGGGC